MSTCQERLEEAQKIIAEQEEAIEKLASPAGKTGVVVNYDKDADLYVVLSGGQESTVFPPKKIKLAVGDQVVINSMSGQIIHKLNVPILRQMPANVRRVVDEDRVELEVGGHTSVHRRLNENVDLSKAQPGTRVFLDTSGNYVTEVLSETDEKPSKPTVNVHWDDIGGQHEAKQAIREAIELPFKYPELYEAYNKRPPKGVLLSGPPGCGKTLLAKAAATALDSGFFYVKATEILNMYVGETEATIRRLFRQGRQFYEEYGKPAMIFIDEADAVLGQRGSGGRSFMTQTIVPTFLTEMDGLVTSDSIVVLSTNRPEDLDAAIVRDGRIDQKIHVGRPDREAVNQIMQIYLRDLPAVDEVADVAIHALFDNAPALYNVTFEDGSTDTFTFRHLVSGAMAENLVALSSALAIRRDIDNGGTPTGITPADMEQAVELVIHQNSRLNHREAILDFADHRPIHNVERIL